MSFYVLKKQERRALKSWQKNKRQKVDILVMSTLRTYKKGVSIGVQTYTSNA